MKAMVLDKPGPIEHNRLRLAELPRPVPEENEILIKVSCCGLCHTDLDEIEGRLPPTKWPIVLGHQIVGTVADKGSSAGRFGIEQRVGITWLYSSCGKCSFCRSGCENLCDDAKWTGKDADGGYAEYMVVREDFAHPIPEVFSDEQAAPLLCAGVIGYRAVKLSQISNGQIVGLFGFGASAHIVIRFSSKKVGE
ncbi:MAG TPA: alcohol dehydrogenase catalytic domain-containing protein [Sedimentisphaerales bacterium]|nr:alcohol dehydrogenase catalytic domain-containing protein [Sedimentisphaerales bacterium]